VKKTIYLPFEQAREFARGLGLKNTAEWFLYCKGELAQRMQSSYTPRITVPSVRLLREFRVLSIEDKPADIPTSPNIIYEDKGWDSWGDWLDTGNVCYRKHLPFEEARKIARSLGLNNSREWFLYCKDKMKTPNVSHQLPKEIPRQPHRKYKDKGWISWENWLDRKTHYRSFKKAREFARSLRLTKCEDWFYYCSDNFQKTHFKPKLPKDIPRQPQKFYKKMGCWVSWPDWLGYEVKISQSRLRAGKTQYHSFEEARKFVHSLSLKSYSEWRLYCRGKMPEKGGKPKYIHSRPATFYGYKGWKGFEDWLGINSKKKK